MCIFPTFVVSVSSLISGNPYSYINVNNIGDLYISAFNTSRSDTIVSDCIQLWQLCITVVILGLVGFDACTTEPEGFAKGQNGCSATY